MAVEKADRHPDGIVHTVPTNLRAEAGELAVKVRKVASALERPWVTDAAFKPLPDQLLDIAESALAMRRSLTS